MVPAVSAVVREFAPADGRIVVDAESLALDEEPPAPRPRGRRTSRALKAARGGGTEPVPPNREGETAPSDAGPA
jgi:hypothetical protein